ncbi:MAG TPA: SDR family NAD(P)-dependent oxidoreductase [Baekduia sp.]|uniref:SDR family NAD(P)-dependent oxidoreductase n=1 Tax=Baekduia sp. TaxID=2600305 RepID=UPI002D76F4B1|nr:SDR family NAD(P)-dependent oxidoreductase [Baekduia sp.]HET6509125.1 SDR family NAD(P)-dependent oxidoreductase [Baekduia sp.]
MVTRDDRADEGTGVSGAVLVTGAGSGIGRAVAIRMSRQGACLGLLDRDAAGLGATAERVRACGAVALELPGDVTLDADLAGAVARVEDAAGAIAGVVAAAGIWAPGTVETLAPPAWSRALAVNVTGVYLTARHAIPALRRAGGGAFVALASDVGVHAARECAAYVATKHAVVGLIRALALDHGPDGIRSNAVCPGFVETPMLDRIFDVERPSGRETRRAQVPLGRFATPEDVAGLVEFLLSGAGSYVNGEALLLDGGAAAGPL